MGPDRSRSARRGATGLHPTARPAASRSRALRRSAIRPPAASPPRRADHPDVTPPVVPAENAVAASQIPGLMAPRSRGRSTALIGQIVVELGYATEEAVENAVHHARESQRLTGRVLIEDGVLTPMQLARVLGERFGVERVDLSMFAVDEAVAKLVDAGFVRRHDAIPVGKDAEGNLLLAMADPTGYMAIDDVTMLTGMQVRPVVAAYDEIQRLSQRLGRDFPELDETTSVEAAPDLDLDTAPENHNIDGPADDAPIVKLVNSVLKRAIRHGASDIHFDPGPEEMRVVLRVD